MHEASTPADATHLKRGTDAPNDEDGRDLRLSAADRSAAEFYAAMIAPSGARPSVTKRSILVGDPHRRLLRSAPSGSATSTS
jgi:hypothetical protein